MTLGGGVGVGVGGRAGEEELAENGIRPAHEFSSPFSVGAAMRAGDGVAPDKMWKNIKSSSDQPPASVRNGRRILSVNQGSGTVKKYPLKAR